MIETFYDEPTPVPEVVCEHCGEKTTSQVYTLVLTRAKLEREWQFDSLNCLRAWAAPVS